MIVMKFGGSSVSDRRRIDEALTIAGKELEKAPVFVASALGNTTCQLEMIAENAQNGNIETAQNILDAVRGFHENTVQSFLSGERLADAEKDLSELFSGISSFMKALSFLRECTDRSRDTLLSFGELLSAVVIAARAREMHIRTEHLDSRDFIRTDGNFTRAIPIFHITNRLIRDTVRPEPGKLIIVQGAIGSSGNGITTMLGENGADYTAAIIGTALHAEAVEIWTETKGIMVCDPKHVPDARSIMEIGYEEAAELAYFGARTVHPSAIQLAVNNGIPVCIRDITAPETPGTRIVSETAESGIRAISGKENITLITVTSSRMLNAFGFLSRIFSIFEKHMTSVDLVATSEVSVSMTIDDDGSLESIQQDLSEIGTVSISRDMSIICLVGRQLWKEPSFIARVFSVLKSTPIQMISLGSSDVNLSVVVSGGALQPAIRRLYSEFFHE